MNPVRVAIIGAGGQVGAFILRAFAHDRLVDVVGICRNRVIAAPLRIEGLPVRIGSVTEASAIQELLGDREVIVNCALPTGGTGPVGAENRDIVKALYTSPSVRRVVQFSSVSIYEPTDTHTEAFEAPRPRSAGANSKVRLERDVSELAARHRIGTWILRMGHVFGPGQWVSRAVGEIVSDPGAALPFAGERPSNAIHVDNVATAVRSIASGEVIPGVYNLLNAPPLSWRELFDWHTEAMGLASVRSMSADETAAQVKYHQAHTWETASRRLARDLKGWMFSLPNVVATSAAARDLGQRLILSMGTGGQRIKSVYRKLNARSGARASGRIMEPWLFNPALPGPLVPYIGRPLEKLSDALGSWYRAATDPTGIELQ